MLQDVVAPGCGPDGNAVQGFVRSFASQKSEFQHDAMRAAHQDQHDLLPEELEHEGHFHEPHAPPLVHAMDPQMREFMHADRAIDRADPLRMLHRPPIERPWAAEMRAQRAARERHDEGWAREFDEQHHEAHPWVGEFQRPRDVWADEFARQREHEDLERAWRENEGWVSEFGDKFQGKAEDEEEAEWYNSFLKKEAQRKEDSKEVLQELSNKLHAIADPKLRRSNFLKFINRISNGEVLLQDNKAIEVVPEQREQDGDWASEFAEQETGVRRMPPAASEAEEWAREFSNPVARQHGRHAWVDEFDGVRQHEETGDDWAREFDEGEESYVRDFAKWDKDLWQHDAPAMLQSLDNYQFAEENPYLNHAEPFQRGKELLARAQLSEAILAFEAEVQRHPDNAEAWRMLGQTHAQSDKDDRAIAALRKAISLNARDMDAHIALAVSYTNEMYRDEALASLEKWLQYHPEYKDLLAAQGPVKLDEFGNEYDQHGQPIDKQDKITDLYLAAARMHAEHPDPDVQVALGLLFNLSFEYEKAVECFSLALEKRPDDYLLWNKLGATLANSNRSEEAITVYFKALDFNPNFVRARANLGISFLALKDYPNAAQQFVQALRLQPGARHIWANLRTALSSMERTDLLTKSMKFDINEFRDDFD